MKERILYRLYVDEIGISGFSNKMVEINDRYFGLCGVVVSDAEAKKLSQYFSDLRRIIDPDIDEWTSIHFHRRDIVLKRGVFKVLEDENRRKRFDEQLIKIFSEIEYKIIFIGLDKKSFLERGNIPVNIYHYLMNVMVEKYVEVLESLGGRGDIMFECSGAKEDGLLQAEYQHFCEIGSKKCSSKRIFNSITSKRLKFKDKSKNISGIELADMLAYVSLNNLLEDSNLKKLQGDTFNFRIFETILRKFAFKGNLLI